ncbi:MAG: ribosomal protein S18-alanine N-acetyltransferase [Chloroflexi bacterium]|nr:ribosomal protein S18-alanine N-acetyltransferase [Chloroflexota bacterium]
MPMAKRDIPTVSQIEREVFSLPWSSTAFRYEIERANTACYLVLRYTPWMIDEEETSWLAPVRRVLRRPAFDPSLLGYGGCWFMVDEAHISTLAVRPAWRGRGLGELLLVSLIEEAYRHQVNLVTLEVRVGNLVAQNLYAKYGFRQVGRRKAYYSDNREDAYIMTTDPIASPAYRRQFDTLRDALRRRLLAQPNDPPAEVSEL